MVNTAERKWFNWALITLIVILSIGVLKTIGCDLFLEKKQGKLATIKQKYSTEGDVKRITLSFDPAGSYTHSYINKDYLPSPQSGELEQYEYIVTYVSKNGKNEVFYGIELPDGQVIQSKRWDVLSAYLNQAFIVFILVAIPAGLYIVYRKQFIIQKRDAYGLLLYGFLLAYIWGKLHVFLMILLILGLLKLGQYLSRAKEKPTLRQEGEVPKA